MDTPETSRASGRATPPGAARPDADAPARRPGPPARRAAGALGDRLPAPARAGARRALLGVGLATARWRTAPSVVVVGAQRCGSTTLFRLLAEHPELVRPTSVKGTGYFDDGHHHGPRWHRAHFPLEATARRQARRTGAERVRAFEVSGFYLVHPLAAARIARELPDAHVVAVLRDPVERAHSAHKHEVRRGFETLDLPAALAAEESRTRGELERLAADPRATSHALRHHAYRGRGEYARQLRRYVDALGRERVHVVDAGDLFADPQPTLAALWDGLGLRPWAPDAVPRWNPTGGGALDPAVRVDLERHFASHDAALEELTGRRPSWRRSTVAASPATAPTAPAGAAR